MAGLAVLVAGASAACTASSLPPATSSSIDSPQSSSASPPDPLGSSTATPPSSPSGSPTPVATGAPTSAVAALALLPVKGRAPRTGYSRAQFGQAWADVDRNGCDTRNDILRRDLTSVTLKPSTRDCVVLRGVLLDPYTGDTVDFVRGVSTSRDVQIDHVVALSDAWQKGAQQLSAARRTQLANDPLELLAVSGVVNAAKGDSDAASWLPPLRASRCSYVARQVAVKRRYALWVTAAERDAIARVLATCPSQRLPT
jgi:hypothetical protein